LRHTVVRKSGRAHTYWRLVRSVRCGRKVWQETVAQLGELDGEGRARARLLAQQITGRADQPELFEETASGEQAVAVRLKGIRVERTRCFGNVWLGSTLWRALGLEELCTELLPAGREAVPWAQMAAVLVIARLCEPSSELHIAEDWYRKTALEDLLALPPERIDDNRLYRALDRLLPHKEAIEQHLKKRLGELFTLEYDLLLYDVTSTYFEGQAPFNRLAARGYSRDHRPDCKQVCIALVVTREGMPLGYEVFAGNRTDVTTVEEIVETMEARYGLVNRVWVMDRGMMSAENVAWLQETGRRYLIGTPKSDLRKWAREIAEAKDWKNVREGVQAKLCTGPDGAETFVLCRSVERREKEKAMHERFAQRIEQALRKLGDRIDRARRPLERARLERQIGRLLGRNSRAAARYTIDILEDATRPAGLRLQWSINPRWDEWAKHSEGCYVLRTNIIDWDVETLWRTYVQLTDAEAAFRIQKSELSIRPIWHQKTHRVLAHILVCFLAYVLWKTLERWQSRAGLGNSPRTILEELGHIQSTDVVLPLPQDPSRKLRIRCVVRPDKAQALLLDRLGLKLPERLKVPPSIPEM
jgi:transposase